MHVVVMLELVDIEHQQRQRLVLLAGRANSVGSWSSNSRRLPSSVSASVRLWCCSSLMRLHSVIDSRIISSSEPICQLCCVKNVCGNTPKFLSRNTMRAGEERAPRDDVETRRPRTRAAG